MKRNYAIAYVLFFTIQLSFSALAARLNNIYVFGDSLSDQGNLSGLTGGGIPGSDYFNGRFSNGPVYTDFLAQNLGLTLTPAPIFPSAWSAGNGNNFSYGGARTDGHRSGLPLGLNSQISAFVNGVTANDRDSLYIVLAGANDIQDAIGVANDNPAEAKIAMDDSNTAIARVENTALNIANAIGDLSEAGAVHFFVPNSPNWALVPAVTELESNNLGTLVGYSDFARDATIAFNNQLATELSTLASDNLAIDIIPFDFFSLFQEVADNPANYGFSDVATSCYDGDDLGFTGGGSVCANPDEFLFWDRIHPTTVAHRVFANKFTSSIPEPTSLILFLVGLPGLLFRNRYLFHQCFH